MTLKILALLCAALALSFLAACGGEDGDQATTTVTETTGTATGDESGDEDADDSADESEDDAADQDEDDVPIGDDTFFQSPTGNIGCVVASGYARCDISERDWDPGPRPADCPKQTDYGQGIDFELGDEAELVCAGDTTLGTGKKLAYGESITKTDITCTSSEEGVTCGDSEGNGFFISRAGFELAPSS